MSCAEFIHTVILILLYICVFFFFGDTVNIVNVELKITVSAPSNMICLMRQFVDCASVQLR